MNFRVPLYQHHIARVKTGDGKSVTKVTTASDGSYSLEGVSSGTYSVTVKAGKCINDIKEQGMHIASRLEI